MDHWGFVYVKQLQGKPFCQAEYIQGLKQYYKIVAVVDYNVPAHECKQ